MGDSEIRREGRSSLPGLTLPYLLILIADSFAWISTQRMIVFECEQLDGLDKPSMKYREYQAISAQRSALNQLVRVR